MESSALTLMWAALAGGVLLLCAVAVVEGLLARAKAAWHVLVCLLLSGSFTVVMSGLLESISPALQGATALFATKASIGPLTGAFILLLLGKWLGAKRDRALHFSTQWGSVGMLVAAIGLGVLAWTGEAGRDDLLFASALVDGVGVVIGAHACVRAAVLGDRLAWMMALACASVAVSVAGLHGMALWPADMGGTLQLLTALSAGAFCLMVSWLALLRHLQHHPARNQPRTQVDRDPLTQLPTRGQLFKRIDDAVQRSAWLQRECVVIAVSVTNLHGLNAEAGYDIDRDIASQLADRLVKLAGIHNLVGLYDPSCFIVVASALDKPMAARKLGFRLANGLRRSFHLRSHRGSDLRYKAEVGIGMVLMSQRVVDSFMVLEQAESFARAARSFSSRVAVGEVTRDIPAPLEAYAFEGRPNRRPSPTRSTDLSSSSVG